MAHTHWADEQRRLRTHLVLEDDLDVDDPAQIRLVGGVDVSFVKDSPEGEACVSLVVVALPSLEVVWSDCVAARMTLPYIPGFLAFREVPFLVERLAHLRATRPDLVPQVILVDGNGILHPRGLGAASHLGVVANIPTVGVGKTLFAVDGLDEREAKRHARVHLTQAGDACKLVGESGRVWGAVRAFHSTPP